MPERPCAFHPDRLTLVGCSRCERPICTEDMVDAPVGVQCPVCAGRMREGALGQATYRVQQTAEKMPGAAFVRRSSLTQLIIAINAVLFLLMTVADPGDPSGQTLVRFGALPPFLATDQIWRVVTAMFVHIGFTHIGFNMFALYLFGPSVETRFGKLPFLTMYFVAGIAGSAASVAFADPGFRAGASGGVFGILGAMIGTAIVHRGNAVARDQLRGLLGLIALNLMIGFIIPGIDNLAHIGGALAGMVLGIGFELGGPKRRSLGFSAAAAVFALSIALILPNTV
jgi:membrane associated rhomboid family serine protease